MLVATSATDIAYVALAIFLVLCGVGVFWVCLRLGGVLTNTSSLIAGTERDLLPVITKTGGTVDRVNHQLDKLDEATDSAVDAVQAVDEAVRALSFAVKTPVKKSAGAAAGVTHGFATLRARKGWGAAKRSAKEASARREADLEDELRKARGTHPAPPPPAPPTAPAPPPPPPSPPPGGIFEPPSQS